MRCFLSFWVLILFLFNFIYTCSAQLQGEFGVGLGWGLNSNSSHLPETAVRAPLRAILQGGINYELNENWTLGIELSTSVFQRLDIFSLDTQSELEDGTIVVDPQRTYSSIIAFKPAYSFEWKGFEPYVSLGLGYNFLATRTVVDLEGNLQSEKNQSLSILPEIGLGIGDFSVAFKMVFGAQLDQIESLDRNNNPVVMPKNNLFLFYITGNYRFRISKR